MKEIAITLRGAAVHISVTPRMFQLKPDLDIRRWLSSPEELMDNGGIVGERNTAYLHEKLDEWIAMQKGVVNA